MSRPSHPFGQYHRGQLRRGECCSERTIYGTLIGMATKAPTTPTTAGAFERYVADRRAASGEFDAEYLAAKTEIVAIDAIMNALDDAREESGLTKAELARRAGLGPEAVRRLFTIERVNPTLRTVVALATAMELDIHLVPKAG
jgi:DNA-binding phage protein